MNPEKIETTQSSLLIPEKFLDVFFEKAEEISREEYFHRLLLRYRPLVLWKTFAKSGKAKTSYQDEGQNLVKPSLCAFIQPIKDGLRQRLGILQMPTGSNLASSQTGLGFPVQPFLLYF